MVFCFFARWRFFVRFLIGYLDYFWHLKQINNENHVWKHVRLFWFECLSTNSRKWHICQNNLKKNVNLFFITCHIDVIMKQILINYLLKWNISICQIVEINLNRKYLTVFWLRIKYFSWNVKNLSKLIRYCCSKLILLKLIKFEHL